MATKNLKTYRKSYNSWTISLIYASKVRIITEWRDHGIIEYFDREGLVYGAVEADERILWEKVVIPESVKNIALFEYAK